MYLLRTGRGRHQSSPFAITVETGFEAEQAGGRHFHFFSLFFVPIFPYWSPTGIMAQGGETFWKSLQSRVA